MNNIPNLLTVFRLILIPFFIIAFYVDYFLLAAGLFCLAAITDYLDGYLARKLEQSTPFGAFLDPVADKVMVATALVVLVEHYQNIWITLPALVMICREIIISALREWMAELGKRGNVAVSVLGKYKTAAQMSAITALLAQFNPLLDQIGFVLFQVATVLTLWSMVKYLAAAWPSLVEKS